MPLYRLAEFAPETPPTGEFWIAPSAEVIGKVRLGHNTSIWFGAVLRGDNEYIDVGDGTNVQEHCMFHTDIGLGLTVGKGCTVGHRAILHGCTVMDNCLIGIGATVLNNSVIEENCLIGAHTLIPEGKRIPAGSLVMGSPGKVVRQLSEQEIERIRWSALHYVENWKRFAASVTAIS
jgi:carbonic anhydrase/acetyltransferase-like protein (isoleucine patch superfamily)